MATTSRTITGFAGRVGFVARIEMIDFSLGLNYWRIEADESATGYLVPAGIRRDATDREIKGYIAQVVGDANESRRLARAA